MSKKSEIHRRDLYYKKAKKEGYRARSAYKLLDIQREFNIFKRAFYILDLGSAPGSWLQVAKKFGEENLNKYKDQYYWRDHYKIMGLDTKKITPIENVHVIKMDLTSSELQGEINKYFDNKLDLILSDASINKTGNKFSDHIKQINLCYKILNIAEKNLKLKGILVIKIFQGSDFNKFKTKVSSLFRFVKSHKPKSSKKRSSEMYLIGLQKI